MNITEISKGISHIEDLPIDAFIDVLVNLHEYEITEKVDGAEILFGIDERGFYTSREAKGGNRVYSVEDYSVTFPTTYMRSAHILLEQALPSLRAAGLKRGDQVEAEVLYGELPNVVPYSADRNYLIFLRTTEGTVNIDRLKQKLYGQTLSVSIRAPFTNDGKTISLREEKNTWLFSRVPILENNLPTGLLDSHIYEIRKILTIVDVLTGQTYGTLLETPLNRIPFWFKGEWKEIKEHIRERRIYIEKIIYFNHVLPVKEVLLTHLVRNTKSEFGPLVEDGGWIEGVVLTNSNGKMVKLVDKDVFGTVREIAWEKRNYLIEHAKGVESQAGFMGRLLRDMALALGHPELGTIQAKRYLHKVGVLTEDKLYILSENVDFNAVKSYWLSLFTVRESKLYEELDKYCRDSSVLLRDNRILTQAIRKRTLETFASLFDKIKTFKILTEQSNSVPNLILILIGKHLGNLT